MNTLEVLLVEDNAADVVLTRYAFKGCSDAVHLHTAQDGEEALRLLANPQFKPDLIILDLNLPRVDGHTLLERWKRRDVPVVIFSSKGKQAEMQRAMALGARDFVRKPIDLQPFTEAVRGIIRRWALSGR